MIKKRYSPYRVLWSMEGENKPVISQVHLIISCEEHDKKYRSHKNPALVGIREGFLEEVMFLLSPEG